MKQLLSLVLPLLLIAPLQCSAQSGTAVVRGIIVYANGGSTAGLIVKAFDRDLSGEQLLGQPVPVNGAGNYEIPYVQPTGASGVNLIVRVFSRGSVGNERQVGESKQIVNAPSVASINVTIANIATPREPRKTKMQQRAIVRFRVLEPPR